MKYDKFLCHHLVSFAMIPAKDPSTFERQAETFGDMLTVVNGIEMGKERVEGHTK